MAEPVEEKPKKRPRNIYDAPEKKKKLRRQNISVKKKKAMRGQTRRAIGVALHDGER